MSRSTWFICWVTAASLTLPFGARAQYTANSQTNIISGVTSNWSGNYYIGNTFSTNVLIVQSNGVLTDAIAYLGYSTTSSNNSVLVTDNGSIWSNSWLYVGFNGYGNRLVISNGAQVLNGGEGQVGAAGSLPRIVNNSVLVTGNNSVWSNGQSLVVGNPGSGNRVEIRNGGLLISYNGRVGSYYPSSSNNSVLVIDPNSVWTNTSDLYVGDWGVSNSLTVSNGGKVFSGYGYMGNQTGASNNSVVLSGTGSLWTNRNDLSIGYSGAGNSLTILSSGKVCSSIGYIGNNATASGNSVLVSGTGSVWRIVNGLYAGNNGAGNGLTVSNGSQLITHFDNYVGNNSSSSNNSVVVTGPGSVWDNTDPFNGFMFYVGYSGAGNSLVIGNGGKLVINNSTIGFNSSASNNSVLVTDPGSVWSNLSALCVGGSGARNSLVISNGARVVSGSGYVGQYNLLGGNNSVVVSGNGSVWKTDNGLTVGFSGSSNSLVIDHGGLVVDSDGYVGAGGSSKNSVLVTDPSSVWSNANNLYVGYGGARNSLVIQFTVGVFNQDAYIGFSSTSTSNSVRVLGDPNGIAATRWRAGVLHVGEQGSGNSLVIAGGTVLATNLVIGFNSSTCDNWVQLDSGSLFVTNATGDAVLEVRYGQLILNGGLLKVDRLVMTNACGLFVRNGGTLTVGTLELRPDLDADGDGIPNIWEQTYGLDPLNAADASQDSGNGQTNLQVFQLTSGLDEDGDGFTHLQELIAGTDPNDSASYPHITAVIQQGDDVEIDWEAVGGHSYVVETNATMGAGFADESLVTSVPGVGPTTTNYLDIGGATNTAPRYYRVRLAP